MSLMGGDALAPGQITVALIRRVSGQGEPDYFSYPSPSCSSEMGDPGQYHFDGGDLRWWDIFGAHRPLRSPRRVPEQARFRTGKHGGQPKVSVQK